MKVRTTRSKTASRFLAAMLGIGLGLCIPTSIALADDRTDDDRTNDDRTNLEQLTSQWWQWVFSIPTALNPALDLSGGSCMIWTARFDLVPRR